MPAFRFEEEKSFDANWSAFMAEMNTLDPQLATILAANKEKLAAIVAQGDRDTRARGDFNTAVAAALDSLVAEQNAEET
jgi:hypothetical protein